MPIGRKLVTVTSSPIARSIKRRISTGSAAKGGVQGGRAELVVYPRDGNAFSRTLSRAVYAKEATRSVLYRPTELVATVYGETQDADCRDQ